MAPKQTRQQAQVSPGSSMPCLRGTVRTSLLPDLAAAARSSAGCARYLVIAVGLQKD